MEAELADLFKRTMNANQQIRSDAEHRLSVLEKDPAAIETILLRIMYHENKLIQHSSSIYVVNALKRVWAREDMKNLVLKIEGNILDFLTAEPRSVRLAFLNILQIIFENSDIARIRDIFEKAALYMSSTVRKENLAALTLYEAVFKAETLRFNLESLLSIVFNSNGTVFTHKLTEALVSKDFECAKIAIKILARSYSYYTIPDFLLCLENFRNYVNIALEILKFTNDKDSTFQKMKKWTVFFLYKISHKGLKKYFKNNEFSDYIKNPDTFAVIFDAFKGLVSEYVEGGFQHPKIPVYFCDFFTLSAGNKAGKEFVKAEHMFLLNNFILHVQCYNSSIQETFECEPEKYLRERYNYLASDLHSGTSTLFNEILSLSKEIKYTVIHMLKNYLENENQPNYLYCSYGILGLLANAQKQMLKVLGDKDFFSFINEYILRLVSKSPNPFIVSQILYFMSLTEDCQLKTSAVTDSLTHVVNLINSDHEILAVQACMAMNFFIYNENLAECIRAYIPTLLDKILHFSKVHFLESLGNMMDAIIETYAEEVGIYAPQFATIIANNALEHISSDNDDKVSTVSGFITSIEKLIMISDNDKNIVWKIFSSSLNLIYTVFNNKLEDFYQEIFDLLNSFLFILEKLSVELVNLCMTALSIDNDELTLYPREVCDLIDNFLSFGKNECITSQSLEKIYNAVNVFLPVASNEEENDIYDDDFEAGCKIVDSLMLNAGSAVRFLNKELISHFIYKIVSNYGMVSSNTNLDVFGLEAIMNCFLVAPEDVLVALGTFKETFFMDVVEKQAKFKRVYDKKVYLLFVGELYKMKCPLPVSFGKINEALVEVLSSLPAAITRRNKLKEEEETRGDEYENYSGEIDESDEGFVDDDMLEEDIWFETVLDKFDVFEYIKSILMAPVVMSVGEQAIACLTETQINKINSVLSVPQAAQK
ncbi:importin-7 [Enteropsectra breve]|nr:importin-7 [Enteropsectra breve]